MVKSFNFKYSFTKFNENLFIIENFLKTACVYEKKHENMKPEYETSINFKYPHNKKNY